MDWRTQARVVGVLDIVLGALAAFAGLIAIIWVQFGLEIAARESGEGWLRGMGAYLAITIIMAVLLIGLPSILAGVGILRGQEWGRILGIVVAALWTLSVLGGNVFGLVGIYMIIVLVQAGNLDGQQQQQVVVEYD